MITDLQFVGLMAVLLSLSCFAAMHMVCRTRILFLISLQYAAFVFGVAATVIGILT